MVTTANIILYILIFVLIVLIFWVIRTEMRLKKFFLGKKAKDLEESLNHIINELNNLQKSEKEISLQISNIEGRLKRSIQGVETIRFNPFQDSGGNQSFAIGLLNESGDGVVISSLYARDRVNVFAKPIKNHKSVYDLTEEEKEALQKAKLF